MIRALWHMFLKWVLLIAFVVWVVICLFYLTPEGLSAMFGLSKSMACGVSILCYAFFGYVVWFSILEAPERVQGGGYQKTFVFNPEYRHMNSKYFLRTDNFEDPLVADIEDCCIDVVSFSCEGGRYKKDNVIEITVRWYNNRTWYDIYRTVKSIIFEYVED